MKRKQRAQLAWNEAMGILKDAQATPEKKKAKRHKKKRG